MYIRLLLCVDDYGFYSADPIEVARSAFPRREDMTSKNIEPIIQRLNEVGLIVRYEYDDDVYLMITNFMNSPRAKASKYPAPDGRMITSPTGMMAHVLHMHNSCKQMHVTCKQMLR